jgi:phosphohistidine phosphatase SixA
MDRRLALLLFALLAFITPARAADDEAWKLLTRPGAVILMRHAEAPGTYDPPGFKLGDCATQRNLSDAGRAQARRIGQAFARRGIKIDLVRSSPWCRTLETARLLDLGPVEEWRALASRSLVQADKDAHVREIRAWLTTLPPERTVMLVSHNFTIDALTKVSTASGEMVILRRGANGVFEVSGRLRVD